VLSAFRQWLIEAEAWRRAVATSQESPPSAGHVDMHSMVREWIGLKQELKLEARGSKAARVRLDEAVHAFHGGVDRVADESKGVLESVVRDRDRLRDEAHQRQESEARSWAEVFIDIRDVLARAADASRRATRRLGWRRWLLKGTSIESAQEGYELALKQIDAALASRGIQDIACQGGPVDPHRMRVVELVQREDVPPGHVVDVVRRGYIWKSRVLRYAEVRATAAESRETNVGDGPRMDDENDQERKRE